MKTQITLLFFLLTGLLSAQAQDAPLEDVVYLRNGSQLRGTLLENRPGGAVKIQLLGGSIFVLEQGEVDSIAKAPRFVDPKSILPLQRKKTGWWNASTMGLNFGQTAGGYNNTGTVGIAVHNVTGYFIHPAIGIGLGAGFDYYDSYYSPMVPLYLQVEGMWIREGPTPYYFASGGYGLSLSGEQQNGWGYTRHEDGGLFWQAGLGIRLFTQRDLHFVLQVAYRQQHRTITERYDWNNSVQELSITQPRLVFSWGIAF